MTSHEWIAKLVGTLEAVEGFECPLQQATLLIGAALGISSDELLRSAAVELNDQQQQYIRAYLDTRPLKPVPLHLGYCEVRGIRLRVSCATLLPGTETEPFIDIAENLIREVHSDRMIDVGTGCGVLPTVLGVSKTALRVYATELSPEALEVAADNVKNYGLADRISLHLGSWFTPLESLGIQETVGLVVSNPPYCIRGMLSQLPKGFSNYAPPLAIDGGDDGLAGHRAVISDGMRFLRPGGALLVQTNSGQADKVASYFRSYRGFDSIRLVGGSSSESRFVVAHKRKGASA